MRPLHLLVPLDGSPLSLAILPAVRGLAPRRVTLLRVRSPGEDPDAERDLAFLAARLERDGLEAVGAVVREGRPAAEILAAARELAPDMIALTTHGRTGFDRLVLGSVAETVIRAATVPVLALRATETASLDEPAPEVLARVLIAADDGELAPHIIEKLAWLDPGRRAKIEVLGVVEALGGPKIIPARPTSDALIEVQRLRRDEMANACGAIAARARGLGFAAPESRVEFGAPGNTILDRAERDGATLIAIATHGRSGVSRWTLGSLTEKVLRAATLPVLVCR